MFFIVAVVLVSFKTYSSIFITKGSRNTWIISILTSILLISYGLFLIYVSKKTNNYNFKEIIYSSLGYCLGKFYLSLFAVCLLLSGIECASVQSNLIHSNFFLETPIYFILIFFVGLNTYCLSKSLDTVLILTVILIALTILSGIFLAVLVEKYKDYSNLFPVFENLFDFKDFQCLLLQLGAVSSLIIVVPLIYNIADKENLKKYSLITLIFVAQILIFSMIGSISSFGANRASNILYPKLIQTQRIHYGGFLENGELYVLFQLTSSWFLKYIISLNVLFELFKNKIKNKKVFSVIISIIIFISSYFCTKNTFVLFKLLEIYQYINLIIFFIFPFIIYAIYLFKSKKTYKYSNFQC